MNIHLDIDDKINKLFHDEGWPDDWIDPLKELLKLNNGHIDSFILRNNFAISWSRCKRLSDSLIEIGCAEPFSDKMIKHNLPKENH